jgi:hypothetical protein
MIHERAGEGHETQEIPAHAAPERGGVLLHVDEGGAPYDAYFAADRDAQPPLMNHPG